MARTVLELAKDAAAVIGIEDFATLVGNNSPAPRAMRVLLNRSGQNLARARNSFGESWLALVNTSEILTSPGIASYPFPEDFVSLVDDTVWDQTQFYEARGALSPQDWQALKNGLVQDNVTLAPFYRIVRSGGRESKEMELYPVPTDTRTLVYEYNSSGWLKDPVQQAFHSRVTQDTDEVVLDAELVEMDLIWRFKQSRGLTFSAELGEFEAERDRRLADDRGAKVIRLGRGQRLARYPNTPLSGFGG